jgi:ABC-type multidrug transport system fused ATPase/permease subunit
MPPPIRPHTSTLASLRSLRRILTRGAQRKLLLATTGSVVIGVLDSLAVALVLPIVDLATNSGLHSTPVRIAKDVFGTSNTDTLKLLLSVSLVLLFVLKDLGSIWFNWWAQTFTNAERVQVSARILERYLTLPYTVMARRSAAELMRTMDASVLQVFTYTITGIISFVVAFFALVTILTALLLLAPLPTLGLIVYFGLASWVYLRMVRGPAALAGQRMNESSRHGWRTAFAALGGMKEVKLRGTHRHFVDEFRDAQLEGAYAGRTAAILNALPNYILEICFITAIGLIVGLSGHTSGSGSGALAQVALFVAAGFRALPSVTSLLGSVSGIRIGADAVELVAAEMERFSVRSDPSRPLEPAAGATHAPAPERRSWDTITIEDVSFSYLENATPALSGIDLTLPRGRSLALVGPSGAGKTTLVDVILGLHAPQKGRIAANGTDIASDPAWWSSILGYVPQDVYLLDASLAENVAFDVTRAEVDDDRLRSAIQAADLDEVVADLPEGVDTWLGERGVRLSGGQRQRVGIARALYRDPEILVLDEATSALDNETEHRISTTLNALAGQVTLIVVAHRLSTVRHVDQVAFINHGRVETIGTFESVEAENADFARLVELGAL